MPANASQPLPCTYMCSPRNITRPCSRITDRDGRILDSLQHNVPSALNGALKHNTRDSSVPAGDRISADQAIHLYPFHFAPECEVCALRCRLSWGCLNPHLHPAHQGPMGATPGAMLQL